MNKDIKIINTEEGLSNIKNSCQGCGSTDIVFYPKKGKLYCKYCKNSFEPKELNNIKNVNELKQRVIGSGAK